MTYNIRLGGRRRRDLRRVVRSLQPDVLLVNESPKTPLLWRRQCRRLARDWGMRYAAGGRDAGSNLVVVSDRIEVLHTRTRVLPQPWGRPRRGIVVVRVRLGDQVWSCLGVHLGLAADARGRELSAVLDEAAAEPDPVLLGGDLNEPAGRPSWTRLAGAGFRDLGREQGPTFPARHPSERIDALLVRGEVVEGAVRPAASGADPARGRPAPPVATASDHRPVVADVRREGIR